MAYFDNSNQATKTFTDFNNIQPRTRQEREALRDKDRVEKTRINQRFGLEAKNVDVKSLLHQAPPQSTLYVAENERFDKDFAVADKRKREKEFDQREQIKEKKRLEGLEREQLKWDRLDLMEQKDQVKKESHAMQLTNGKRNMNGLAYNPITLEYEKTDKGLQLRKQDEDSKVRQFVRAQNLDTRGNCNYNLMTGEQRAGIETIVPNHLKEHYSTKLRQKNEFYNIKHYAIQQQLVNTNSQFNNTNNNQFVG